VEDDADGGKYWDVEDGVKLGGEFVGLVEDEGDASVAEVDDCGVFLSGVREYGVGFGACERYALPLSIFPAPGRM